MLSGEGYTIKYDGDNSVEYNENFSFSIEIKDEYYKTDAFAVKVDSVNIELQEENGTYLIEGITSDKTVTVVGIDTVQSQSSGNKGANDINSSGTMIALLLKRKKQNIRISQSTDK